MTNKGYLKILVLTMLCSLLLLTACRLGGDISKFIPKELDSVEEPNKDPKDEDKSLAMPTEKGLPTRDKEDAGESQGGKDNEPMKNSKVKDDILAQQKSNTIESKTPLWEDIGEVKIPIEEMSVVELVDYLISQVPEVHGYIHRLGMTAKVDGSLTELDLVNYFCRDVWVGTDTDNKFTNEFLYTISPTGQIYEFDIITNDWYCVSNGDRLILAHVKFNEIVSEEWIELLVDDLLWIDDPDAPNGYIIENEVEEWETLYAAFWSNYYVLVDDEETGVNSYSISMDNFVKEINNEWRQGEMLAHIFVEKGTIVDIIEQYVP